MKRNPFVDEKSVRTTRKEYAEKLTTLAKEDFCPFCKKDIKVHHTNKIINEHAWMVTENLFPYTKKKHHLLFITKRHITKIEQLNEQEWVELYKLLKKYLRKDHIAHGGFLAKFGNTTTIKHLHFHLVQDTRIGKIVL